MAERNAPIADWFSTAWPDSADDLWPDDVGSFFGSGDSTGRSSGSGAPIYGGASPDWRGAADQYWDGREQGSYPRGLRVPRGTGIGGGVNTTPNAGAGGSTGASTGGGGGFRNPLDPFMNQGNKRGGNGNGGGSNGGGGGGKPRGMSLREYIEYQEQAAQSAARAQARETRLGVYDWVRSSFQQWGMPDGFANDVIGIVKDARSPEQAMTMIRDTDAYRTRFAGNIARAEAGFGMLSEAEYLNLESSYRQSMRAAGLPEGFYDDPNDFADFISKDVSPEEIAARAEIAGSLAQQKDPQLWKELESRGISKGDAAAYMLDPDRALPAIQRKLAGADIGRAAREAGIKVKNKFENKLVDKGVSTEAAKAAFVSVKAEEKDLDALAARYGEKEFGKKGLIKGELGLDKGKTVARRKSLASRERAEWAGQAGSASMAFGQSEE